MASRRLPIATFKYKEIFESLKSDIVSGRYKPGQRLPSDAALVNRSGASRITVTRAVRELQSAGLVNRVPGLGTYVRDLARGLRIPQDIAIVGIDDVPYAKLLPVPLTTVRQPTCAIGEAALRTMLDRIGMPHTRPREVVLDGELIIRKSRGASSK